MKKINISRLSSSITDSFDLFICSSSFESRCRSAPYRLRNKKFQNVIIIENRNGSRIIHENTRAICEYFGRNTQVLSIDYQNPIDIADKIYSVIKRDPRGRKINVLVDITTFTHETLMIMLKIISIKRRQVSVTCLYTNASDYCPNSNLSKKWLSRGCGELHSILGYSGFLLPSRKNRMVILVGYEYYRAADIISTFEPNYLTLVYGSPDNATAEKNKEANQLYHHLLQQMSFNYDHVESIEIPCDNPDRTAEILSSLYESHSDENIIIIPMNNKLSTVGVAKSILLNESVQACYAPAVIYNENDYSTPGSYCYIFKY